MPTQNQIRLICKNSDSYETAEHVDLIFTQVYAELLIKRHLGILTPMVLMGRPGKELYRLSSMLHPVGKMFVPKVHYLYTYMLGDLDIRLADYAPENGFWPLDFCVDVLDQTTEPGDLVLDPFMGRGTVGRAAKQLGRRFIGIDKNPERVKMAEEYIWKS